MFRRQLPAYSPLTLRGLISGVGGARSRPRERLAELLAGRYGARRVVLTGSGTQALTLALRASVPEDRAPVVALPAYACYDVVSAAVGADARMVFYDLDPLTLSPNLESLAEVCDERKPDAVVVAPLYGIPVDWDLVRDTVAPCGALLVEDAAQGMGASWRGRPVGSLGEVSVLSFGRGKGWTGGTGGALLERAPRRPAPLPSVRAEADAGVALRAAAQWLLGRPRTYWIPASLPWLALGETVYHPPTEAQTMPRLAASLVLAHDGEALRECEVRKRNAAELLGQLEASEAASSFTLLHPPPDGEAGYLRLPVLAAGGMSGFADPEAARSLGVMPGYPRPLPELPAARERRVEASAIPGAARIVAELVTLPTHRFLTSSGRALAAETVSTLGTGVRPSRTVYPHRHA